MGGCTVTDGRPKIVPSGPADATSRRSLLVRRKRLGRAPWLSILSVSERWARTGRSRSPTWRLRELLLRPSGSPDPICEERDSGDGRPEREDMVAVQKCCVGGLTVGRREEDRPTAAFSRPEEEQMRVGLVRWGPALVLAVAGAPGFWPGRSCAAARGAASAVAGAASAGERLSAGFAVRDAADAGAVRLGWAALFLASGDSGVVQPVPLYAGGKDGRGARSLSSTPMAATRWRTTCTCSTGRSGWRAMCGEEGVTCASGMPKFSQLSLQGSPATKAPPSKSQGTGQEDKSAWALEVALDVETAHAIAPGANILLVHTPTAETLGVQGFPQMMNAEQYVVDHHLADVISQSFGSAEEAFGSASRSRTCATPSSPPRTTG